MSSKTTYDLPSDTPPSVLREDGIEYPDIEKCPFVVDRKDLDRQTREEFEAPSSPNECRSGERGGDHQFGVQQESHANFACLQHLLTHHSIAA